MSRKPSSMYRYVRGQPSTRKEYMGGIPASRITQFVLGNKTEKFPVEISLHSLERCNVRHNALESARITVNRAMEKKVGSANYRLSVRVYPHVVLRENKQATGAGADRVSQGMRASYGKIVSTAAEVKQNQKIITIETTEQFIEEAKNALRKAGMKIPSPCKVIIGKAS
ncbi:50S ribosomal protein L16 [Thermoplasmatales archaeon SG8-52-4]|nr:MAG: 50S ribosomal protein L16 [Thermoplasmatales archaeon SG8-52-4]